MKSLTKTYCDQLGRLVDIPSLPKRVVSLVPSQTELLFDLGLDETLVGITKFCIHPKDKVSRKPIVGGTKNFRFDTIDQLSPDLIIGNKEENYQEGLTQLASKYTVWITDVENLPQAQAMITDLGQLFGKESSAQFLNQKITSGFAKLRSLSNAPRVAYLIWRKPYMVAGQNTFIQEMLRMCGFVNPFAEKQEESRYPEVDQERLRSAKLDHIFLSSEPFPFKEKHRSEILEFCPQTKVHFVDGEMFSWYGSRMLKAVAYFEQLLQDPLFGGSF